MEERISVWKGALNGGIVLGLISTIYSYTIYFLGITFEPIAGYIWIALFVIILFLLMKQFRDKYRGGFVSYGGVFGSGVVISLYSSIIIAISTYLLYGVIDDTLLLHQLAMAENKLIEMGLSEEQIAMQMSVTEKITTPAITSVIQFISNLFFGVIVALIGALFLRKEGNPLIDETE